MPNKWTFKIKPIKELLEKYNVNGGWIDPFAGMHSPAEITNDLNPDANSKYHLEALDFVNSLDGQYNGCLFDPPYSLTQVGRSYQDFGIKGWNKSNRTGAFPSVKDRLAKIIKPNGVVISFGWNSIGMGKKRGFEPIEILLVSHGGNRNDTIVTVEKKQTKGE